MLWQIPKAQIKNINVPRLFLGDHGFLRVYGSRLTDTEIIERMQYALSKGTLGLAAGDERCLRSAREAFLSLGRSPTILYHSDLRLRIGTNQIDLDRAMAGLYQWLLEKDSQKIQTDPIVGAFLVGYKDSKVYQSNELSDLQIDSNAWRQELKLIDEMDPTIITIGGDLLDFAVIAGRPDIVIDYLSPLREISISKKIPLFLTLYIGSYGLKPPVIPPDLYDGLMVPINAQGYGMFPSGPDLLSVLKCLNKPIIAMHVLGSGRIDPKAGLNYVYSKVNANIAVVGASKHRHIDYLIEAGQDFFASSYIIN